VIFGLGGGIDALHRVPAAGFNLVVSPWVGLSVVELLQEKFGTPYLHYPVLPIGPTETGEFLRRVGEYAGIDSSIVSRVINESEEVYYHYIERCADFLFESRSGMPSRFVTISDSSYVLGISRFLINDLGMIPLMQFVTDDTPEEHRSRIESALQEVVPGISSPVAFSSDGGAIHEELRRARLRGKPFILGSTWDRVIARELNGYSLSVSLPVSDRLVLNRSYAGYYGALRLAEDIYSVILGDYQ
jgi:nitrogenase molybdenum-iron protein beta chain